MTWEARYLEKGMTKIMEAKPAKAEMPRSLGEELMRRFWRCGGWGTYWYR